MATLNKSQLSISLSNKIEELEARIVEMKNDINLSQATVRTQTHLKSHEAHLLQVIYELLDNCGEEVSLSEDASGWLASAATLTEDRKKGSIIFKEGDSIIEIMDEHPNSNYKKLKAMLEKQGFALEGSTIVKA